MEIPFKRKKRKSPEGVPDYMTTYADMVTLLLVFFILLISAAKIEGREIKLILANFPGLGNLIGGSTFTEGPLPGSGYLVEALPSKVKQDTLDKLKNIAQSILKPEVSANATRVSLDERGLVISLASDVFFSKYSAELNLQKSGVTLRKVAGLLRTYLQEQGETEDAYRIEGHTDEVNMPIGSLYKDEWDLSAARASSVLRFMKQFLLPTDSAQITGFGNTKPLYESTPVGSAFNRRVDIVILNKGNL